MLMGKSSGKREKRGKASWQIWIPVKKNNKGNTVRV